MIKRFLKWAVGLFIATVLIVIGLTLALPTSATEDYAKADVIVVYGAGMSADGTLDKSSLLRVERGVSLFDAGKSPKMHFTGGRRVPNGPSAGAQMAAHAVSLGVPEHAISHEDRSHSTLQNALFSAPYLSDFDSAILVSEGFHLPRVYLTNLWAGGPKEVQLAYSTRFRGAADETLVRATPMVLREAIAWWFNIARASAYDVAGWFGVPQERREAWLK